MVELEVYIYDVMWAANPVAWKWTKCINDKSENWQVDGKNTFCRDKTNIFVVKWTAIYSTVGGSGYWMVGLLLTWGLASNSKIAKTERQKNIVRGRADN